MQHLLETVEFRDRTRAAGIISKLAQDVPADIQEQMRYLLAASADPDGALHGLESLYISNPGTFRFFVQSPVTLQYLVTVFSYSRFLSEEIIQHPEWLDELAREEAIDRVLLTEDLEDKLELQLGPDPGAPSPLTLALFRRQQIFRILLRDVLDVATLSETTEELSNLADAILNVTYRRIREDRLPFGSQVMFITPSFWALYKWRIIGALALLAALPRIDRRRDKRLRSIPGAPPNLLVQPKGCPFAARCELVFDRCRAEMPPLIQVGANHQAACWFDVTSGKPR